MTFVRSILERQGWRRVLLVRSPYHMRRALLMWKKQTPEIEVVATPVPRSQFYEHGGSASLEQLRGLVQGYAATVVYCWRGWL